MEKIVNKSSKSKYTITHLGKTLVTTHWVNIPKSMCNEIRQNYRKKPRKSVVNDQLKKIAEGGKDVSHITGYYFMDLMSKVKLDSARWSIEEMLKCDDLIRYYYSRIL